MKIQEVGASMDLLNAGYEEPFVHFCGAEAPSFLVPAVREFLGLANADEATHVLAKDR